MGKDHKHHLKETLKSLILKTAIFGLVLFNIYIGFLFYHVAIPIQIPNVERIVIERIADTFNISTELSRTFVFQGRYKRVDPVLLATIASPESEFNPNALSKKGYRGIMQASKQKFEFTSLDILNGIEKFCDFLRMANGDTRIALARYNYGTRPIIPKESYNYADKILANYKKVREVIYYGT